MNPTELLDQFVAEARECLETIGQRLLDVERNPLDAALLGDLFRNVHTLKGPRCTCSPAIRGCESSCSERTEFLTTRNPS